MARKLRRQDRRPTDRDLQAYVDGQLDAARRAEVRDAVRCDSGLRAVVKRYQTQRRMLRRIFDPILAEPVPQPLARLLLHPAKRRLH